jgi:hypothetical protein
VETPNHGLNRTVAPGRGNVRLARSFSTPLRSVENAAVERELLPSTPLRENQEFETDAPPGHRSTAALGRLAKKRFEKRTREVEGYVNINIL